MVAPAPAARRADRKPGDRAVKKAKRHALSYSGMAAIAQPARTGQDLRSSSPASMLESTSAIAKTRSQQHEVDPPPSARACPKGMMKRPAR